MKRFAPVVGALAAMIMVVSVASGAQEPARQLAFAERGPRFYLEARPTPVRVDVSKSPMLRHRLSLDLRDVSVHEALQTIGRRAGGLELMYSAELVTGLRPVTLRAEDISVASALSEVLLDAGVDVLFTASGNAALIKRPSDVRVVDGTITGRVADQATSQPIRGAAVLLDGTGRATTGDDGAFRIAGVTAGTHTLMVRYLGYAPASQTITVADDQTVTADFALAQRVSALDQVVVTGTAGPVERRAVANAIAKIDAAAITAVAPVTNVSDLLTGRAAGVVLTASSGMVGGGAKISIRGRNSLSLSTQPIVYVDGIRIDNAATTGPPGVQGVQVISRINDIAPSDIESIEVIKGPAAATLYGTEASNGVIQIITKAGRSSDKVRIEASIEQGTNAIANPNGRIPTNFGRNTAGQVVIYNAAQSEADRGSPIWRTGYTQRYGLSASGGSGVVTYHVSGNVVNEQGVDRRNEQEQMSSRANLSFQPRANFSTRFDVGLINGKINLTPQEGSVGNIYGAIIANPLLKDTPTRGFPAGPPEVLSDTRDAFQLLRRTTASVQLQHQLGTHFAQRLSAGVDYVGENNQNIVRYMTPYQAQFFSPLAAQGSKSVALRDAATSTVDYSGTLTYSVSSSLTSTTAFGAQYYDRFTRFTNASGTQFAAPALETILGTATRTSSDDYVENATIGLYGQEQVAWKNRLFLTGAVRVDNNSAFGKDYKLATYPKVSASWVINEEPWWNVGLIQTLKLRAAYGVAGQQPDAFSALRTLAPTTGPGDQPALATQAVGNSELKPERSSEVELGFDAELFQRLGLEFTYYDQNRRDAILQAPVAPSSGFTGTQLINAGRVTNKGAEFKATLAVMDAPRFGWDLTASASTNSSNIVDLGGQPPIFVGTFPRAQQQRVGFPVAAYFAQSIVSATLDATGTATNLMCDAGPGAAPVACATAPRVYVGRSTPKYEGALTSTFRFAQHVRLYAMVDFKAGYERFDTNDWARCSVFRYCEENYFPERFSAVRDAYVQRGSGLTLVDGFINDASFAKLREVSLNVDLPSVALRGIRASRGTITLSGRNLHTWTRWTGLDPDLENNSFGELSSSEQAILPQPMQFRVKLNVTY